MSPAQSRLIAICLILGFALTPICNGITVGPVVVTPAASFLLLAAMLTVYARFANGLPIITESLIREPAVWSAAIYFAIGLCTGFVAEDKVSFIKEIIQRTTVIWLPVFGLSMGLRKAKYAQYLLLGYVGTTSVLAFVATAAAVTSKFDQPVYILGLHKNMTASLCATMGIICVAHLFTSKKLFLGFKNFKVPNKLLFLGAFALAMMGILASQGRAALIEVVFATYLMLFAMRAKPKTMVLLTIAFIVGIAILFKVMPEKALEHVVTTQRHSANAVRLELWTDMWHNFMEDPFHACGWGNPFIDKRGWFYYDLACVLLFDWMQMSIVGAIALIFMMIFSMRMVLITARRASPHSIEGFVGLAAVGIVGGKFAHGLLDTFWIARGANLHTWIGVGLGLFLKLWLDQNQSSKRRVEKIPTKTGALR